MGLFRFIPQVFNLNLFALKCWCYSNVAIHPKLLNGNYFSNSCGAFQVYSPGFQFEYICPEMLKLFKCSAIHLELLQRNYFSYSSAYNKLPPRLGAGSYLNCYTVELTFSVRKSILFHLTIPTKQMLYLQDTLSSSTETCRSTWQKRIGQNKIMTTASSSQK